MGSFNRRDLLKAMATGVAAFGLQSAVQALPGLTVAGGHIILLVFDAWSAENVSLYGYNRPTMPNLEHWANKATIYARHHSAGSFTIPGVASLVTGTYPFQHRALTLKSQMAAGFGEKTIFNAVRPKLHTQAYTQNPYAAQILEQSKQDIETLIPMNAFNLDKWYLFDQKPFDHDAYMAFNTLDVGIFNKNANNSTSLFLGPAYDMARSAQQQGMVDSQKDLYPLGLPNYGEVFSMASVLEGIISTLDGLREPSFVYFHVYTPHEPYAPYTKYLEEFSSDNKKFDMHPNHPLVKTPNRKEVTLKDRRNYDAYLASWDEELSRLFAYLKSSGMRDNSTIMITADHGEMFDRGVIGHQTDLLSQPLLHVPLIVTQPGQSWQHTVQTPTCSVDILPTVCGLAGVDVPAWAEGVALPGLGGEQDFERVFFAFDAKNNSMFGKFTNYSAAIYKGTKKLTVYQHPPYTGKEFYDVQKDPQEQNDLYQDNLTDAQAMEATLMEKLDTAQAKV